jgi:hypothetical protein
MPLPCLASFCESTTAYKVMSNDSSPIRGATLPAPTGVLTCSCGYRGRIVYQYPRIINTGDPLGKAKQKSFQSSCSCKP